MKVLRRLKLAARCPVSGCWPSCFLTPWRSHRGIDWWSTQ